MGLTRITSDGITDATIATADLADQSVTLAKLPHGTSSNDGKFLRANNGADPTFESVITDLVNDTSPQLGGNLDVNTKNINFGDSASSSDDRLTFGAGTDLSIYHQASNNTSYLLNTSTNLTFMTSGTNVNIKSDTGETLAKFVKNGAVELYHNNNKKFETTSDGVEVTGNIIPDANNTRNIGNGTTNFNSIWASTRFRGNDNVKLVLGNSQDLVIRHDGTQSIIGSPQGHNLQIKSGTGDNDNQLCAQFNHNGAVELYHNNSKKFETTSAGATVTGSLTVTDHVLVGHHDYLYFTSTAGFSPRIGNADGGTGQNMTFHTNNTMRVMLENGGHLRPASNNSYDLGTSSDRWRNVYTNDLNLSNEGGSNDVDGTWGSYTIQEGAEDLFLVNKRNGKKYKFNLTEVS